MNKNDKQSVKANNKQFVGIDQGYNKLISDSNGVHWGKELKQIYIKLANKKRGSKNYNQLLTYKRIKINEVVNRFIDFYKDTDIVCEDLNRVKHASKLYKKTNNKLQLEPAYTSQTCSKCGQIIKANRNRRTL